jgi:hypothetical protein
VADTKKEHLALKKKGYNHDKRRKKWNYGAKIF